MANTTKKRKNSLLKTLCLTFGIAIVVIVGFVVIIKAVNKVKVDYIIVDGACKELYVGNPQYNTAEFSVGIYPEKYSSEGLLVYSSNSDVATAVIDNGVLKVSAVSEGNASIVVYLASNSKISDSVDIVVRDEDIENFNFVNDDGEKVETVDVKKDGFEHKIKFNLDPIDANMNNLAVVYSENVLGKAYIDQESGSLVVVPKIDIIQTTTTVDVEIIQDSVIGKVVSQHIELLINLKSRESYLRFKMSNESIFDDSEAKIYNNIVYLEKNDANDVYIRPQIGYDSLFENLGVFNIEDYKVYFDGEEVLWVNNKFDYKNKLSISKENPNYFYIKTLEAFEQDDFVYITFEHAFTETRENLQISYLAVEDIQLSNNDIFSLTTNPELELNDVDALNFSYDKAVEYGIIEIYSFIPDGGDTTKRIKTNKFGDPSNDETVEIIRTYNKLQVYAKDITQNTNVWFGIKCNYWDNRYVRIDEKSYISIGFKVLYKVNDFYVEENGLRTNVVSLSKNGDQKVLNIKTLPYGENSFDINNLVISVKDNNPSNPAVFQTSFNENENTFSIAFIGGAQGTYCLELKFGSITKTLYVVVE